MFPEEQGDQTVVIKGQRDPFIGVFGYGVPLSSVSTSIPQSQADFAIISTVSISPTKAVAEAETTLTSTIWPLRRSMAGT